MRFCQGRVLGDYRKFAAAVFGWICFGHGCGLAMAILMHKSKIIFALFSPLSKR